ncbi:MAG: YciI-like protein [Betaproteobacteria bacterium]
MHFLLMYEAAENYVTARTPFRKAHLEYANAAVERGELVLGGALANPPDGAVILFKGDSAKAAEDFAKSDPYVKNGVIKSWKVREWTTVVGADAQVTVDLKTL